MRAALLQTSMSESLEFFCNVNYDAKSISDGTGGIGQSFR